jgi:hypothetical protein
MYVHACVNEYIHMSVHVCVCTYVCIYVCLNVSMFQGNVLSQCLRSFIRNSESCPIK